MDPMVTFIGGAGFLASLVIALYFLRFWRETRDRLFAIFSLAFTVFAVNRFFLTFIDEAHEGRTYLYLVRLLVFLLILAAIVDKNVSGRQSDDS
jgi:drug/metabolite transporter superfamily protein YnfA